MTVFTTLNARRHVPPFARRNGPFGMAKNTSLTRRLRFPVVSNSRMHTITMHITNQYNQSIYNHNRDDWSFILLGLSICCQQLTISSDLLKNSDTMGDYHYYGNDPDGARIYHNPKSNSFISRDRIFKAWFVS